MDINAVQQGTGNTGLILPDLRGGAAARAAPVAIVTAGA